MNTPIRIVANFRKVDIDDLGDWLQENKIKYAFVPVPADPQNNNAIGDLKFYIEVYDAKHETAIRIKWDLS